MNFKKIKEEQENNALEVTFKPIDTTHKVDEIKAITELLKLYLGRLCQEERRDNIVIKACEDRIAELLKLIDND